MRNSFKRVIPIFMTAVLLMSIPQDAYAWRLFGKEETNLGGGSDGCCAYVIIETKKYFMGIVVGTKTERVDVNCLC